jgi:hypothetical protein
MKSATVASIPDLANLNHQVDEVLHTEYSVIGYRVLLINGFHKKPKVIDNLDDLGVNPEITASHHCMEEFFL